MPLFGRRQPPQFQPTVLPPSRIPVDQFDPEKRYDVYCAVASEERLYENVRFVGIRTFGQPVQFIGGLVGGAFLEIELPGGPRLLIPNQGIQLICEHGVEPAFRVLRQWGN